MHGPVSRHLFWLASLMFFLSGGTGMAYQVIWFKRFAHVLGKLEPGVRLGRRLVSFWAGCGSLAIGAARRLLPATTAWYGFCELAIGVAAIVIPFQIEWLIDASAGFYAYLPDQPLARYLLQFAITLLVVGAPCVLMGGTLPLLIRELTGRDGALDQATGWLYAINTFGAASGCYLAGFVLLPTMGLGWTNTLAAATNVGIGLAAVLVSRRSHVRRSRACGGNRRRRFPVVSQANLRLYAAAALSGLGALTLEMTWSRQLALVLGGSTYAYRATLFIVLTGIAAGSLIFHLGLRRVAFGLAAGGANRHIGSGLLRSAVFCCRGCQCNWASIEICGNRSSATH